MPLDNLNDPLLRAPRSHAPTIAGMTEAANTATPEQLADFVDAIGASGGGGGGGHPPTDLGATATPTGVTVTSSTGADALLPLATATNAGLMAPAQHAKLADLPTAATYAADQAAQDLAISGKAPATHTHTPAAIGAATTAQGAKADSALQPGVLPVGTTLPAAQISDATTTGRALLTAADAAAQRTALALGNVSNTADADKPVSTAQALAIAAATTADAIADTLEAAATGAPADLARIKSSVSGAAFSPRSIFADLLSNRSATMWLQGDSTGNESTEWFYQLAQKIGAVVPSARIEYRLWNPATLNLDYMPNVQDGTGGERYSAAGKVINFADLPARASPDIDLRIKVSHPTWAVSAEEVLLSQFSSAGGNRAFRWYLAAGNSPKFAWTTDGTAETTVTGTSITGLSAGAATWLRVTLDVDNGAGGYTWAMYTSTDGNTWTAAGGASTSAGVTSIYASTDAHQIGMRSANGTGLFSGGIYKVEFRDGIAGPNIYPLSIDDWRQYTVGADLTTKVFGAPTLYVCNGSESGRSISFFLPTIAKMTPRAIGSTFYFLSTGHNESGIAGGGSVKTTAADIAAWIDAAKSRSPYGKGFTIMQNPRIQARVGGSDHQRIFVGLFADIAETKGLKPIDVYRAFVNDPRGAAALVSAIDGIHPTQGPNSGSSLWADTAYAELSKR